jgi:hypothetical protein
MRPVILLHQCRRKPALHQEDYLQMPSSTSTTVLDQILARLDDVVHLLHERQLLVLHERRLLDRIAMLEAKVKELKKKTLARRAA